MNPWLEFTLSPSGKVTMDLNMGNEHRKIGGLKPVAAKSVAKRLIISAIRKYLNHRRKIIFEYGGHRNASIDKSLRNLEYAFLGPTAKWNLEDLPRIIRNWSKDLINIAPNPRSRFYRSQSQFLHDLMAWANNELKSNYYGVR